jgi:hypothetical protein
LATSTSLERRLRRFDATIVAPVRNLPRIVGWAAITVGVALMLIGAFR